MGATHDSSFQSISNELIFCNREQIQEEKTEKPDVRLKNSHHIYYNLLLQC